ncbi:hypothetical protein PHMEG_00031205, partial [Phytophthora megakarya]
LGRSLLVIPVLTEEATNVTGYVPYGVWYNLFDYTKTQSAGSVVSWNVTLYDMPVLVRGGSVLPMHQAALTSTAARNTSYNLLVALSENGTATGELYQDDIDAINVDGQSTFVNFDVAGGTLNSKVAQNNYDGDKFTNSIANVIVLGISAKPSQIVTSSSDAELSFSYNATLEALTIDMSNANLSVVEDFALSWQ